MGIRDKILLAGMVVRGVVTFGLAVYTMVNFAKWLLDNRDLENDEQSNLTL